MGEPVVHWQRSDVLRPRRRLDDYLARATELGGEVQRPPTEAGDVRLAVFADPRGNSVGLIEA
jgi:predicted enzyme related to lactoylglutathione lyase